MLSHKDLERALCALEQWGESDPVGSYEIVKDYLKILLGDRVALNLGFHSIDLKEFTLL